MGGARTALPIIRYILSKLCYSSRDLFFTTFSLWKVGPGVGGHPALYPAYSLRGDQTYASKAFFLAARGVVITKS